LLQQKYFIMNGEARKLHLIEALLRENNDAVLKEVEKALSHSALKAVPRKSFSELTGSISKEEAEELEKIIEEGCDQINPDDWK
jgi:hypothetical protein